MLDRKSISIAKIAEIEGEEVNLVGEIISVLIQTIWTFITGTIGFVWNNLPTLIEIKQITSYMTPLGFIAAFVGVPLFVLKIGVTIVNRLL